jgi:hypothetical protein
MNPTALTSLTSFVTLLIALSVAFERVVEVLKGFFPTNSLFQANADPVTEPTTVPGFTSSRERAATQWRGLER